MDVVMPPGAQVMSASPLCDPTVHWMIREPRSGVAPRSSDDSVLCPVLFPYDYVPESAQLVVECVFVESEVVVHIGGSVRCV